MTDDTYVRMPKSLMDYLFHSLALATSWLHGRWPTWLSLHEFPRWRTPK